MLWPFDTVYKDVTPELQPLHGLERRGRQAEGGGEKRQREPGSLWVS